ncbi:hypothetical protein A9Q84_09645 [Halobacteriovorax marinus]|uniref:ABC-2 type transporter transmembrane domain-containing protein n=1 Tax=Halobacteriovorax marinus TaxID=97084 RepID=A0A1Y5FCB8_9BACT|nr:hypothetical protein A9Q84_09645 [Halobacteriovorax marinus]
MRSYILSTIIKRDLKETYRNPQTLIILGITIGINVFMSLLFGKALWVMTFSMSLVMVGFTITSFMITEEKDKLTLDALLVSPASYQEILFGKLFLTFSITLSVTFSLIFSLHHEEVSVLHTLLSVPLGALVICLFGVVVGLICQTQAMLSGIGTILMLALFLPELLASANVYLGYFARALPTHHVIQLASLGKEGFSPLILKHYGVLVLSLTATIFWVSSFIKTAISQESHKWKFDRRNKVTSFILLMTLVFSSVVFLPLKGQVLQTSGNSYSYQNTQYKLSIPFLPKKFELKEFSFQNKYVVKFHLIDRPADYIYISMQKNNKGISSKENYEERLLKVRKEDAINLNLSRSIGANEVVLDRFEYETQKGKYLYYIFSTKDFLYKIGIEASNVEGESYSYLREYLQKYIQQMTL